MLRYGIRNTKSGFMVNTQYAIRNTQYAIRNTEYAKDDKEILLYVVWFSKHYMFYSAFRYVNHTASLLVEPLFGQVKIGATLLLVTSSTTRTMG